MTTLTLLVKAFNPRQLKLIDELLKAQFEELGVEFSVLGAPINKWVQVSVEGEDEAVAASYVKKEFGTCPVTLENATAATSLKGYISKIDEAKQELIVDVGIIEPKLLYAHVSLANLQAELVDGKQLALKKICELYGLIEELPLIVKIQPQSQESGEIKAELSPLQAEGLRMWRDSLLDRLIVLRLSQSEVELVVERTRLERDVIDLEKLGMFEYALTCKLGTDAAGLIPRVGRYMRNARFVVFNARKIRDFLGEQGLKP